MKIKLRFGEQAASYTMGFDDGSQNFGYGFQDVQEVHTGTVIPSGGETREFLVKASERDFDTKWASKKELGIDQTFVYEQRSAASTWMIEHNLDKYPSVTVVDSAGSVVVGDVKYLSRDSLLLTFRGGFSGMAYLN